MLEPRIQVERAVNFSRRGAFPLERLMPAFVVSFEQRIMKVNMRGEEVQTLWV